MKKPDLKIVIGDKPGRGPGRGSDPGSMDPMGSGMGDMEDMDDMDDMSTSSVDMALEDAFNAVKVGDMQAFKEAMLDALDSLR